MDRIPVSVDSDDPVVPVGMLESLRRHPEVELFEGEMPDGAVLVLCVDVIDDSSLAAMRRMTGGGLLCTVLVAGTIQEARLVDTIECGVVTVLRRREASPAAVLRAVKAAHSGDGELPPDLLRGLMAQIGRARRADAERGFAAAPGLSPREADVIKLVAEGFNTRQIAVKLSYSERTVKNVLHDLLMRLQLRNRAHAVAYAARHGYL